MNTSAGDLAVISFRPGDGTVTPERLDGWFEAQSRGFHQGRTSEEHRRRYREHLDADDAVLRGIWADAPSLGSGTLPVATFGSFDKTLNTGSALLPLRMITDVTVSPTHRRQGLLRKLMTEDLRDAAEQGIPLAALTVSEGSIYGRFGFGMATFARHVEVDTSARFALRELTDDGHIELLEPTEAWPTVASLFARFHALTRGSVERPQFYEPILKGTFDFDEGPDRKLRVAVHLDADGNPDGYVAYRPGPREKGHRSVKVADLVALSASAYLRIWRFLADLDLSDRVVWNNAPMDDPLPWALVEPFAAKVTNVDDSLWVRVLDVVAALQARPWGAPGSVVLRVDDPMGHAAGTWRVTTRDGLAEVAASDDEPEIRLPADVLGALYLGGVDVGTLRAAGRLSGDPGALDTWAAMSRVGPAPYCITGF